MATRRWCRNRIKKRRLSERSEFPTLPDFGASGVCSPRSGPPSSGSPSLAYFSWRRKRSRSAAGPRPGLVVRQAKPSCFIRQPGLAAKPPLPWQRLHSARRHCSACWTGETSNRSLPWGVAGCSSRRPTRFFAPPKKWGKKGGPYDGGPRCADCTRRQELKREASETRFAQTADASLSVSVPGDASPSNGDPRQRQRQKQLQLQLSLRGQLHLSLRGACNIAYRPAWASQHETALARASPPAS